VDADALAVAGDVNLARAWALLGRHAAFPVTETGSVTLTSSGLPIAFFNGAFVHRAPNDAAATIGAVKAFYEGRGVPYLLWVRDAIGVEVIAAGLAAGLRHGGGPPAMGLATIGDIPPPPAELHLFLASSTDDVDAHRAVVCGGFGMPLDVAHRIIATSLVDDPDLAIVVGRVAGAPVVTALLARSGTTAGVYNVATLPEHRGKGYGAAATWAVVAEGARRGCTHSVLQASEAGYPVYRRMGYVDLGRYVQLEGPPTA
jgi:GNAT superfamily N-acetyltransferase